jgi:alpha-tubulin suppressor-like RCC1 family protein
MTIGRYADWGLLALVVLLAGCGARTTLGDGTEATGVVDGTGGRSGGGGTNGRPIQTLSAASSHACAVTTGGAAKCWGFNRTGQLGNDFTLDSSFPVDVFGLSSGVAAVAVGAGHSCALTRSGGVMCWGWNHFGQLGDGSFTDSALPVDVVGLSSGVVAIACGNGVSCAVLREGGVKCWGTTIAPGGAVPTDVPGVTSVVAASAGMATGDEQACVLTSSGAAKCWGINANGELGTGSTESSSVPVDVQGLSSGVRSISAGNGYTCAVTAAGAVDCWGGDYGQFGTPLYGGSVVPVEIPGLSSGITAVAAGDVQACALTSKGGAKCWGMNEHGQLGDGTTDDSRSPLDVAGLSSGVTTLSAADGFTCAALKSGAVKCWGANTYGQLGNGSRDESHVPVDVVGF